MKDAKAVVSRIKKRLLELGPVLPGSLSKQWNVCGSSGCGVADSRNERGS
ncbi:MAG: DUF6788 family protein [Planctomycetota bacterium]